MDNQEFEKVYIVKTNKLYVLYKNKYSVYNEIKYKSYKNKLQNVTRNAKKSYYGSQNEENKTHLSKSWKILKELVTSNERFNVTQSL